MGNNTKFVDFEEYCKTCEHEKKKDIEDPCNECLDICAREGSSKPERWEAKRNERPPYKNTETVIRLC